MGILIHGLLYEGTWYLYPLEVTKTGYRQVSALGCIVDNNRTSAEYIKTALHELGHAVGWNGHSANTSDVMYGYGSSVTVLTNRDKNHLSQVY